MITTLLVGTLAVTWAWEALRQIENRLPWGLPDFVLPLLVYGLALAFCWPDWKIAAAAAGLAGLIRTLLRGRISDGPSQMLRPRSSRIPPLP